MHALLAADLAPKAVVPHMASRKSGLVIFTGSIAGNLSVLPAPKSPPTLTPPQPLAVVRPVQRVQSRTPLPRRHAREGAACASSSSRSARYARTSAPPHDFAPAPAFRKNIDARLGQGEDVMSADEYARRVADAALALAPPRYLSFGGQARGAWLLGFLPRTARLELLWKTYSGKTPKA
jgi:1-acylglycerone phosphate reductase